MSFNDQRAAQLLAICNDIGEASYLSSAVAASLLETLRRLPSGQDNLAKLTERFKVEWTHEMSGEAQHTTSAA